MIHQRHVIREAIVAALAAAGTAAGGRVFDNPVDPRDVFPALVVEDDGELQTVQALHRTPARPIERTMVLTVSAEVQQTNQWARQRDQLLADVESVLATTNFPGIKDLVPAGCQMDQTGDGERPIAVARQRFEITYMTPQGDPSTFL